MTENNTYMFPTSVKEVKALGWDYIDVILFTGDAFIDHPSFGTAVIARWLQKHGYRVAVVPQPNWRDDLRDFRKLGAPRLYFGVNSGAMDSMVNHYTANFTNFAGWPTAWYIFAGYALVIAVLFAILFKDKKTAK